MRLGGISRGGDLTVPCTDPPQRLALPLLLVGDSCTITDKRSRSSCNRPLPSQVCHADYSRTIGIPGPALHKTENM